MEELRSKIYQAAYYGRETRLDLLADICLVQQQFPKPKVLHIKWYNKMVERALEHAPTFKLYFRKYKKVKFLASSDAAWNNAGGFKSQMGLVIWACDESIRHGGSRLTPIYWQSKKQPRIANSTLSAEAMACTTATDELDYTTALWMEMNHCDFDLRKWHYKDSEQDIYGLEREGFITVDAKCLFDSVNGVGTKMPSCKRTALEVALINETVQNGHHGFKWVPTEEMLADALTKVGKKCERLYEIISGGEYHLKKLVGL
jgi:hypothetical protein